MAREPHAVPRGLLRFYILRLLVNKPMKGYEVITDIEGRTEGMWKPGPGSIYPMLDSLKKEGLVRPATPSKGRRIQTRGTTLQITEKGKETLANFRRNVTHGITARARNLFKIFMDLAYPGLGFDDVVLAQRRREIDTLKEVLKDDYWNTVSDERREKFFDLFSKMVEEELEMVRKGLLTARDKENKI